MTVACPFLQAQSVFCLILFCIATKQNFPEMITWSDFELTKHKKHGGFPVHYNHYEEKELLTSEHMQKEAMKKWNKRKNNCLLQKIADTVGFGPTSAVYSHTKVTRNNTITVSTSHTKELSKLQWENPDADNNAGNQWTKFSTSGMHLTLTLQLKKWDKELEKRVPFTKDSEYPPQDTFAWHVSQPHLASMKKTSISMKRNADKEFVTLSMWSYSLNVLLKSLVAFLDLKCSRPEAHYDLLLATRISNRDLWNHVMKLLQ